MARRDAMRASLISPKSSDSLVSSLTWNSFSGFFFFFFLGLADGARAGLLDPGDKLRFFLLSFTTTEWLILGKKRGFLLFFLCAGEISMSRLGFEDSPEMRPGALRSSGDGLSEEEICSLRRFGDFFLFVSRIDAGPPRLIDSGDALFLRSELGISGSLMPLRLLVGEPDPIKESCSSLIYFCLSCLLICF